MNSNGMTGKKIKNMILNLKEFNDEQLDAFSFEVENEQLRRTFKEIRKCTSP